MLRRKGPFRMVTLNNEQKKLIEAKNFAHVATLNKDGSPQVSPVWIDMDGQYLVFNTEQKRRKVKNMRRDPRVSLAVQDMSNPYRYLEIRGRVVDITPTKGAEHIDKLAKKYLGQEKYPYNQPGDVRLIVKVEPAKITGMA